MVSAMTLGGVDLHLFPDVLQRHGPRPLLGGGIGGLLDGVGDLIGGLVGGLLASLVQSAGQSTKALRPEVVQDLMLLVLGLPLLLELCLFLVFLSSFFLLFLAVEVDVVGWGEDDRGLLGRGGGCDIDHHIVDG